MGVQCSPSKLAEGRRTASLRQCLEMSYVTMGVNVFYFLGDS